MAGTDGREPWDDYRTLRRELREYDRRLLRLPALVVANKMDCEGAERKLRRFARETRRQALPVSALDGRGTDELKTRLWDALRPVAPAAAADAVPPPPEPATRAAPEPEPTPAPEETLTPERLRAARFLDLGAPLRPGKRR
jgi:GTPase involved in cell partitioning and DNA repair